MGVAPRNTLYFQPGGTLHVADPSYVPRPADDQLFSEVHRGQLCYVLTTRQMGKSSLMIRTAARLKAEGVDSAIVDLSTLGAQVNADEWYLGIVTMIADDLALAVEARAWWEERQARGVVQRFVEFLAEEVIARRVARCVIFLDEIDSTLSLDFTDDFFAAIRSIYNERVVNPAYDLITFVLLGVASPASLIKDRGRTPFNIGRAIDLAEFRRADASPLVTGLARFYPGAEEVLLDRIFVWTSGHPYLTQKLCAALARAAHEHPIALADTVGDAVGDAAARVDAWVEQLFLAKDARNEENLQFVRSRVEANPERSTLLALYRRIYEGEVVGEDDRSPLQNELKLIGLVTAREGALCVRNEIYRRVFDLRWLRDATPRNWSAVVTAVAVLVTVAAIAGVFFFQRYTEERTVQSAIDLFHDSRTVEDRIVSLANLCTLRQEAAQREFLDLLAGQQDPFRTVRVIAVRKHLPPVVRCLQPALTGLSATEAAAARQTMCDALLRLCAAEGRTEEAACSCPPGPP